ncbi:uncharacterized protein LOC130814549 isoform X2 [Amaranthus tricolor]|uniref:uncharacterized protein LOC130814549 isoform X2 n=1 Tax=Amaranthus tricolor TaxID=29722 RepID=UPI002586CA2E|nr:uncharacterized protein LOC130814549 isoform X2 [Amaranthus tricolor]
MGMHSDCTILRRLKVQIFIQSVSHLMKVGVARIILRLVAPFGYRTEKCMQLCQYEVNKQVVTCVASERTDHILVFEDRMNSWSFLRVQLVIFNFWNPV